MAESQRLREQGEARVFSDASGVGAVIMMDCPGQESRLVLSSGEGIASFTPILDLPFWSVEELPVELQFLLSCGFKPDIHRVKKLAPRLDVNEVRLPGM